MAAPKFSQADEVLRSEIASLREEVAGLRADLAARAAAAPAPVAAAGSFVCGPCKRDPQGCSTVEARTAHIESWNAAASASRRARFAARQAAAVPPAEEPAA